MGRTIGRSWQPVRRARRETVTRAGPGFASAAVKGYVRGPGADERKTILEG